MKNLANFIGKALIAVAFFALSSLACPTARAERFEICGYNNKPGLFWSEASEHLTHILLFSAVPTATGEVNFDEFKQTPWLELKNWKNKTNGRVSICIGGWGKGTEEFAIVAASPEKRQSFIKTVLAFCLTHGIDGVDMDWEFPKPNQMGDFHTLLKELHAALNPHKIRLSVAVNTGVGNMKTVADCVDTLMVMTYDMGKRHSTLEDTKAKCLKLIAAGVPRQKIILGIPFYGRNMENTAISMGYGAIVAQHKPAPEVDEAGGMYFNGVETVAKKTLFAREQKLGGVMIWSVSAGGANAPELLLLTSIRQAAERPLPAAPENP